MVQLSHTGLELDAAIRNFKERYANVSGVTATASRVLSGYKFVGSDKVLRNGTYTPPQLFAPTISMSGSILIFSPNSDNGSFPQFYDIYKNGTLLASVAASTTEVDLSQYAIGASDSVTVKARATGFRDSAASSPQQYQAYSVTYHLTGCHAQYGATSIAFDGAYLDNFIVDSSSYTMQGATVTITMGGTDVTSAAYTQESTSRSRVVIPRVIGNVVITITARRLD